MDYTYRTKGTCSREISFELDGDRVKNVHFVGGCDGNLKAVAKLVDGMIFVVCRGYCEKKPLEAALRNMRYLNIKILGFVMTRGTVDKTAYKKKYGKYRYGGYGYGYGYGEAPAGDRQKS